MADPTEPALDELEQAVHVAEGDEAIVAALTELLDYVTHEVSRAEAEHDYDRVSHLAKLSEEACLVAAQRASGRLAQSMIVASTYWGLVADFTGTRPKVGAQPATSPRSTVERQSATGFDVQAGPPASPRGVSNVTPTPSGSESRRRVAASPRETSTGARVKQRPATRSSEGVQDRSKRNDGT
jgi:hypothetical protein